MLKKRSRAFVVFSSDFSESGAMLGQILSQDGLCGRDSPVRHALAQGQKYGGLTVVCHLATKIDPTLLQLQKKRRRILQKLLVSTLTWAIQFSESSFHPRDMFQSRPGRARMRQNHGKSPDSAKIGCEIPGLLSVCGP